MTLEFKSIEREYIRAPIKSSVLYVDGDFVYSAKTHNISEGGVFIFNLPQMPATSEQEMAIFIPHFPRLANLSLSELLLISIEDLPGTVIKVKCKMVRKREQTIDEVITTHVGCELLHPSIKARAMISNYVDIYVKNLVHLLSLFENLVEDSVEKMQELKMVAKLLGYDDTLRPGLLRAKVLHDYQSIGHL